MLSGAIAFSCSGVESCGAVYMTPTAFIPSGVRWYRIDPG